MSRTFYRQACLLTVGCIAAVAVAVWTSLAYCARAADTNSPAPKSTTHWAYIKPVRPALPEAKDRSWCRNALDYFVLANLQNQALHPSRDADPPTLISRVTLALIGV